MAIVMVSDRYEILEERKIDRNKDVLSPIPFYRMRLKIEQGINESIDIIEINGQNEKLITFPFYYTPTWNNDGKIEIIIELLNEPMKKVKFSIVDPFQSMWDEDDKTQLIEWVKKNKIEDFFNNQTNFIENEKPTETASVEKGDDELYLINRASELKIALNGILNNQDVILMEDHFLKNIDDGVTIDRQTVDYFTKHPETWYQIPGKQPQPLKVLSRVTEPKYDVFSNQFVKMVVNDFLVRHTESEIYRLKKIIENVRKRNIKTFMDVNEGIEIYEEQKQGYERILQNCNSFLKEEVFLNKNVKKLPKLYSITPNQVLLKNENYNIIYDIWINIKQKAKQNVIRTIFETKDRDEIHLYRDYIIYGFFVAINSLKFETDEGNNVTGKEKYNGKNILFLEKKFNLTFTMPKEWGVFGYTITFYTNHLKNDNYINPSFLMKISSKDNKKKILVVPLLSGLLNKEIGEFDFQKNLKELVAQFSNNSEIDDILIIHNTNLSDKDEWSWNTQRALKNIGETDINFFGKKIAIIEYTTRETVYPNSSKKLTELFEKGGQAFSTIAPFYSHILRRYLLKKLVSINEDNIKMCPICLSPDKDYINNLLIEVGNQISVKIKQVSKRFDIKEKRMNRLSIVMKNCNSDYSDAVEKFPFPNKGRKSRISQESEFKKEMNSSNTQEIREQYFKIKSIKKRLDEQWHYCECQNINFKIRKCNKCGNEEYDYFWEYGLDKCQENMNELVVKEPYEQIECLESQFNLLCYNTRYEDWSINDEPYNHFVCPECGYGSMNFKEKMESYKL